MMIASATVPVRSASVSTLWFAGTRLIFSDAEPMAGDLAVATRDPGLVHFLARVGATLSYAHGEGYIVVTAADRRTVSLTVGSAAVASRGGTVELPFAPFIEGGATYVPFLALARALYVEPVRDAGETVLQPQIGAIDVQNSGKRTVITLRGATPLRWKKSEDGAGRLIVTFTGIASPLDPRRMVGAPGIGEVEVSSGGTLRNPTTTVSFYGSPDTAHALISPQSPNDAVFEFAPDASLLSGVPVPASSALAAVAVPRPYAAAPLPPVYGPASTPASPGAYPPSSAGGYAQAPPAPVPATTPAGGPGDAGPPDTDELGGASPLPAAVQPYATVTAVDVAPLDDGISVRVAVSGSSAYDWHRLGGGDNRWYIDLHGAALAMAPHEIRSASSSVQSVRVGTVRVIGAPTVRIAMTLSGDKRVEVVPFAGGVTLTVTGEDAIDVARSGNGAVGDPSLAAEPSPATTVPPADGWKFAPQPGAIPSPGAPLAPPPPGSNPRLIVIDPGHGGSDSGAQHNGLTEKVLTLDISKRLRSLLIARGWIVKMTRTTDVDVYGPNASDRAELQARCDVANAAGARMFISVHINSFTTGELNGTTTYYYKPQDRLFAAAIQRHLMNTLATKDDGVRRENFYVVRHTAMPSVLVETAFISNPSDAAQMRQPAFLQNVALGIANGIREYAGTPASIPVSSVGGGE